MPTILYAQQDMGIDTTVLNTIDMNKNQVATEDENYNKTIEENFNEIKDNVLDEEPRMIADSSWQKLIDDDKLKYTEQKEKKEKIYKKPSKTILDNIPKSAGIFVLYAMIALVIVMIIYAFFGKQYFQKKDSSIEKEPVDFEDVIVYNKWQQAIDSAIDKQDYRLAIRILYLQTLQLLHEANCIHYQKESANQAYVQKLYNTRFYKPFYELTRYFDYTWYGKYIISNDAFTNVQQQFVSFQNNIIV